MGDLRQAKYNEEKKLAEKQQALTTAPAEPPLYSDLAQTGIPMAGATLIGSEIGILVNHLRELDTRVDALEQAARNIGAPHLAKTEKR